MKVQLEQREIETAIRQYIANQGLSIGTKLTTITFTATRSRETGIIADLVIEDAGNTVPGYTDRAADAMQTSKVDTDLASVNAGTVGAAILAPQVAVNAAPVIEPETTEPETVEADTLAEEDKSEPAVETATDTDEAVTGAAPASTTSLFG